MRFIVVYRVEKAGEKESEKKWEKEAEKAVRIGCEKQRKSNRRELEKNQEKDVDLDSLIKCLSGFVDLSEFHDHLVSYRGFGQALGVPFACWLWCRRLGQQVDTL